MKKDFIILPNGRAWTAVATSERGRAFAQADGRFQDHRARLAPADASVLFAQLSSQGLSVARPEGLPEGSRRSLMLRLLAAILILFPGIIFIYLLLK
jgi:hypothetical protein